MPKSFPLAPLERVARKAGAERISLAALKALREALLEISEKIARDAANAAKHAGRTTIKKEDIKIVIR